MKLREMKKDRQDTIRVNSSVKKFLLARGISIQGLLDRAIEQELTKGFEMDIFNRIAMLREAAEIPPAIPTSDALDIIGTMVGFKLSSPILTEMNDNKFGLITKALIMKKKLSDFDDNGFEK